MLLNLHRNINKLCNFTLNYYKISKFHTNIAKLINNGKGIAKTV